MFKSIKSVLTGAALAVFCLGVSPAIAEVGDIYKVPGNPRTVRIQTQGNGGFFLTLPRGLFELKQVTGGYNLGYDEAFFSQDQVQAWAKDFCGRMERQPVLAFSDGRGPKRRAVAFRCK